MVNNKEKYGEYKTLEEALSATGLTEDDFVDKNDLVDKLKESETKPNE